MSFSELDRGIAAQVEEQFYKSLYRYLYLEDAREHDPLSVSVTALVYDCMRRGYYQKTEPETMSVDGALRVGTGKKLHEIPFNADKSGHEILLKWEGITGIVDEYHDGVIVDKKTTRDIPKNPYGNHIKQIEYYKVLLEENGHPVVGGAVLYEDVDHAQIRAFSVKLRGSKEIKGEMLAKRDILAPALKNRALPPRSVSWLCKYCNFSKKCFTTEG